MNPTLTPRAAPSPVGTRRRFTRKLALRGNPRVTLCNPGAGPRVNAARLTRYSD